MEANSLDNSFSNLIMYKRDSQPYNQDPYITGGGLVYGILCTFSLFLMITLSIIYGRLEYNRLFAYFCISMVTLYIPHVLGAWIFGANLRRASTAFCWIQALWINASGIAAGLSVLIYSYEIYRRIVCHTTDGEWKRRKYYTAICIVFPLLVGVIPPFLIAERPDGNCPYFCMLYEPSIPMALVSVEGWNTLTSIFGIYFSMRTVIEVIALSYTYEESDKTPQHQLNVGAQEFDHDLNSPATTNP
ncbi:14279_t:CDS:2, partial [Dentiscutata heterogama]